VLIPIQHENMSARRWPVITLGLILVNFVVFLGTHWVMERQDEHIWEVRQHILTLAALHPQLSLQPEAQEWVDAFKAHDPDNWAEMQTPNSQPSDELEARIRQIDDPATLQAEIDSLGTEYSRLMATSISPRYGFIPLHPRPIAYLTSTFLHGGWWHLLASYFPS
jgi:hypothetical protein